MNLDICSCTKVPMLYLWIPEPISILIDMKQNQYFTQQAKKDAAILHVKLWDRNKLNNLIANGKGKDSQIKS